MGVQKGGESPASAVLPVHTTRKVDLICVDCRGVVARFHDDNCFLGNVEAVFDREIRRLLQARNISDSLHNLQQTKGDAMKRVTESPMLSGGVRVNGPYARSMLGWRSENRPEKSMNSGFREGKSQGCSGSSFGYGVTISAILVRPAGPTRQARAVTRPPLKNAAGALVMHPSRLEWRQREKDERRAIKERLSRPFLSSLEPPTGCKRRVAASQVLHVPSSLHCSQPHAAPPRLVDMAHPQGPRRFRNPHGLPSADLSGSSALLPTRTLDSWFPCNHSLAVLGCSS
ncbi:uncharacterized protein K460DRAFT_352799 [Cucurbitaria berberidis CBS 394.84]|uniref:Uncharacterized protein n=1 Tax=Cucurbitaria berberidis CBS 394.84 TaxID=1168544 RepID=A0A9P4GLL7_9PLEO|nr:uncharacterized protein K460DRAFT_352799 [Cucurbitaria berberidis CBS 394.84]KAF1847709.1 hypothetical protein K460DRAFT_352799 [Cucurbitaria berberidis CBS 394.84]